LLVTLGGLALPLVVLFALYAGVCGVIGGLRGKPALVVSAERAVIAVFALLVLAFVGLEAALIGDRFDLAFVAQISAREQPVWFKARSGAARRLALCGPSCSA
jgi:cytochrome c biogenesis factor